MAGLSQAAGILIGIAIAVGPRLAPNSGWRRPVEPRLVAMRVRLGHAFYVLSGRQLDALAGQFA